MLQTLVDTLTDGVVIVTIDDRVIRFANPAACVFLHIDSETLIGSVFEYPMVDGYEFSIQTPSERRVGEIRANDIEWQAQSARVLTIRDVSEQTARRVFERRLAQAHSLSARAQLASGIVQELGDPASYLAANRMVMRDILTQLELMCADPRVPRELRERYNVAQSLQDIRAILDDDATGLDRIRSCLRELGRGVQEKVERVEMVDINQVVREACAFIQESHEGDFALSRELAEVPRIAGDRLKLTQLLVNLIDNAINALKGARRGSNTIQLSTACRDQELYITVRDPGRGIAKEHVHRIFDPLRMMAGQRIRMGVGLAVAAEIVSVHGGRVEVESQLGQGSLFRVILPVQTGYAPSLESSRVLPGQVRARVLWLSSDRERTRAVHELLDADHDVIDSASKQQASSMLDRDRDYDVILADVVANAGDAIALHNTLVTDAPELARRMVLIAPDEMSTKVRRFIEKSHLLVLDKPLAESMLCEVVERMSF